MSVKSLPVFRASSLERLIACPASGALPQINEESGEYAATGTAGHRFLERIAKGDRPVDALEWVDVHYRAMCSRIDLDAIHAPGDDCGVEVSMHYNVWTGLAVDVKPFDIDPLNSVTGTADRVCVHSDRGITITDWKFGRPEYTTPARKNKQLLFYALCASLVTKIQSERIVVQLGFICQETGKVTYDKHEVTYEELQVLKRDLQRAMKERRLLAEGIDAGNSPTVTEGAHCHYCPARNSCPAKVGLIEKFAQGLSLRVDGGSLTKDKVAEAYLKVVDIKKAIAGFEKQLSQWVRKNGDVPLPTGKTLGLRKRRGNEVIDAGVGVEVLASYVGEELASGALTKTLTKKAILEAVKAAGMPNRVADDVIEKVREVDGASRNKDSEYVGEF